MDPRLLIVAVLFVWFCIWLRFIWQNTNESGRTRPRTLAQLEHFALRNTDSGTYRIIAAAILSLRQKRHFTPNEPLSPLLLDYLKQEVRIGIDSLDILVAAMQSPTHNAQETALQLLEGLERKS